MKTQTLTVIITVILTAGSTVAELTYPIVDTGQVHCYDNRNTIEFPKTGNPLYGQDAHYTANPPSYKDNGDGTVSDLVTGLMWTQDPGEKKTFDHAVADTPTGVCRMRKNFRASSTTPARPTPPIPRPSIPKSAMPPNSLKGAARRAMSSASKTWCAVFAEVM